MPHLVRCADGKIAPATIVCKPLLKGESNEWVQLPQEDGGETYDYVCGDCIRKCLDDVPMDDLLTTCFNCTRQMIEEREVNPVGVNAFHG
jgi:hypothetical protein